MKLTSDQHLEATYVSNTFPETDEYHIDYFFPKNIQLYQQPENTKAIASKELLACLATA